MKSVMLAALSVAVLLVHAQEAPEDYLVRQAGVTVDVDDIDALARNIPDDLRFGVMDDPNRIAGYLETIVLHRAVAADARRHGVHEDPLIQREIQIATEGILAKHHVQRSVAALPEPDYEKLARERYRANREQFNRPDVVDVSQILVSTKTRSDEEALARALEVRGKLLEAPDTLEALVAEYSDDPSAVNNRGRFPTVTRGRMVPEFEDVAFALTEPGEVSEPVKTKYGYHVIVLHSKTLGGVRQFDDVKAAIIKDLREKHDEQMREDFLDQFRTQPMEVNEEGVLALRTRYAKRDE